MFRKRRFSSARRSSHHALAKARFEMYSQASCGEDGLPHLIVDGRGSHAGDFVILIMFLTSPAASAGLVVNT